MIQTRFFILFLGLSATLMGQSAIHNFGNLKLHDKGSLGFHSDFINDSGFDKNLGLIGFYHDETHLSISGTSSPVFHDFEMAIEEDLYIDISVGIDNSLNFIYGNIISSRDKKNVYLKLTENAIYDGEMNLSKIDGHVAVEGQKEFSFPVGYEDILRPLTIAFIDGTFFAKCEYYHENPDFPESFSMGYDINSRDTSLGSINTQEFWKLTTSGMVQIALTWDSECNLSSYTENPKNVMVTGWNKKTEQWDNLGNFKYEGTIDKGYVTSNTFNANDYEVFTLGFLYDINNNDLGNYVLTPNGDGANDLFALEIIEKYPNNKLIIFNRDGLIVYEKEDYRNEFKGLGNKNIVLNDQHLPAGVYFYILEMKEHNLKYQGYIYLAK